MKERVPALPRHLNFYQVCLQVPVSGAATAQARTLHRAVKPGCGTLEPRMDRPGLGTVEQYGTVFSGQLLTQDSTVRQLLLQFGHPRACHFRLEQGESGELFQPGQILQPRVCHLGGCQSDLGQLLQRG